jgi:hypothetical protein
VRMETKEAAACWPVLRTAPAGRRAAGYQASRRTAHRPPAPRHPLPPQHQIRTFHAIRRPAARTLHADATRIARRCNQDCTPAAHTHSQEPVPGTRPRSREGLTPRPGLCFTPKLRKVVSNQHDHVNQVGGQESRGYRSTSGATEPASTTSTTPLTHTGTPSGRNTPPPG